MKTQHGRSGDQEDSVIAKDSGEQRILHKHNKTGIIRHPIKTLEEGEDYLCLFRSLDGSFDFPKLLRQRLHLNASVTRAPGSGGQLTLTVPPLRKSNVYAEDWGFEITVDPGQGFLPTAIHVNELRADGKIVRRRTTTVDKIVRLPSGLHVPTKAVTRFFDTRPGNDFGKELYFIQHEVDEAKSRWNVELPADTFKLGFPVGTMVHDFIQKREFISGTADPDKDIKDLLTEAKESIPLNSGKKFKTLASLPWWQDWRWYCGFVIALAVMALGYWMLRRRKAR